MKVLAKKDECSRELRRNAIYTLGNTRDGQYTRTVIDVAKTDPNQDVRRTAIEYLGRVTGDDALGALEELLRTSDDQEIQRAAIRALANNSTPRARNGIKALIERNDVNESLRMSALNSLNAELATTEDVNWLQSLYGKTESQRIRSSIISAMARLGGNQNERWFTTLVNNENESIDVRVTALRQVGPNMDIAALIRLYDQTGQRNLRYELVRQLQNRREPEATDKLGDIAKNGTDVEVRKRAIDALTSKARNDERALKVLLQLIDRP
jgi:HEAT repeat protein